MRAGKLRAIAVTTTKRLTTPALAKLPTLDEAGLKGFNVTIWHGVYAPKGTPKAVVTRQAGMPIAAQVDRPREEPLGRLQRTTTTGHLA